MTCKKAFFNEFNCFLSFVLPFNLVNLTKYVVNSLCNNNIKASDFINDDMKFLLTAKQPQKRDGRTRKLQDASHKSVESAQ